MNTEDFMNLSPEKKVDVVNELLQKESSNHLQNVAKKLGMSPSTFSKVMRHNDNYQYNQSKKQYYKLMSMEEYKRTNQKLPESKVDETLQYLTTNIDKLKELLSNPETQLTINPFIYAPESKTVNKTVQVNADIYNDFQKLTAKKFPHLRIRELVSQSLLEFTEKYKDSDL